MPPTSDASPPAQGVLPLFAPPAAGDETLVPARIVNEWCYCPRLAFLEWAHGEWASSADVAAGRRAHRATEAGRAPPLPAPDALDPDKPFQTRRLLLASEKLGLTAEVDILEADDGKVAPVDVKVGKRPHVAEGAYLPERAQLCVEGAAEVFGQDKAGAVEAPVDLKAQHAKIGELTLANDFLSGALSKAGLLSAKR